MKSVSQSWVVFLVLVGGVLILFLFQRPHSVCDSQIEIFKESQRGQIYPQEIKGGQSRLGPYSRYIGGCRSGNSAGACYDLFMLLKRLLRDFDLVPRQCLVEMAEVENVKAILSENIELLVLLAWGQEPPEPNSSKRFGWLEAPDFSLFCNLKRKYISIFGEEAFDSLRLAIQNKLPGEVTVFREGICVNCEDPRAAVETLGAEQTWLRSIFSLRCEQY